LTVFFKVRSTVKKAAFAKLGSLDDLKKLFFDKYDSLKLKYNEKTLPPFYIMDRGSKILFELEDIADVYNNCVLEVRLGKNELTSFSESESEIGFGYYAFQRQKLCFAMVGLPARGKSYIARKISRYLTWVGVPCKVFNVGSYRRQRLGANQTFEFFDPSNTDGNRARLHMAIAALDDMLNWLNHEGRVAIYDATNSTKERRSMILKRCTKEGVQVVFIESVCNDRAVIEKNIRETKLYSPDYQSQAPDDAIADFTKRIQQYEKSYQTLDETDDDKCYVKLVDVGRQFIANKVESYLPSRIIHFVMNLHTRPRPIWLTRHGESQDNVRGVLGGDSNLTNKGDEYAHNLADWVDKNISGDDLVVWTSTLKRSIQTAQYVNHPKLSLRVLDEIDVGVCDGFTYDEIAEQMPDEFAARAADKLKYRYPHGESYVDVITRLEPVLFELERQKSPVLVVSHQAVLRCIYSYFSGVDNEEIPFLQVSENSLKFT